MAVNNANVISLYIDGTKVAVANSHTLSFEKETIEVTNKDSNGFAEFISGKFSGTASIEGFVDDESSYNFDDLFSVLKKTPSVSFKYTDETVGNKRYEGQCILTSLERSGGNDEAESFSAEMQITGEPTQVDIT